MPRPRTLVLTAVLAGLFTHGGTAPAATSPLALPGSGAGAAVQIPPPGIRGNCRGAPCRYLFRTGTLVTLNAATQVAGVSLARWVGNCDGSTPTCTVEVNG